MDLDSKLATATTAKQKNKQTGKNLSLPTQEDNLSVVNSFFIRCLLGMTCVPGITIIGPRNEVVNNKGKILTSSSFNFVVMERCYFGF